jgi:uncharacterized membrane protein
MAARADTNRTPNWLETPPRTPRLRHWNGMLIKRLSWLDKLARPLQKWTVQLYGQPKQPSYRIKDALNGVWLGHPLHPLLVVLPLGAWTTSLILDMIWLSEYDDGLAHSADLMMWTGLIGATGAAATGLTNWVDIDKPAKRTGMLHALLNGSVTVLNLASALLRLTRQRHPAVVLSSMAYALTAYLAYKINVSYRRWIYFIMTIHSNPMRIFLFSSDKDKSLVRRLEAHLNVLKQQGLISVWQERKTLASANRVKTRSAYLETVWFACPPPPLCMTFRTCGSHTSLLSYAKK